MRTICFVITSHIHYGRSRRILQELKKRKDVTLRIVVGASAILPQYGDVQAAMKADGFASDATITMTLAGGTPLAMAKTTGLGIIEFATVFDNLKPDVVVIRGDRYEVLAAATAAAYMNITVAHIEGGDVTGSIDESVRHAVTKLAHLHFATNEQSKERLLRMGENPKDVFNFGAPELEGIDDVKGSVTSDEVNKLGVGSAIDLKKPFIIVMYHPVTTEAKSNRANTQALLEAVHGSGVQALWFWPNVDAGTDDVAKAIRVFREHTTDYKMHFAKYVAPDMFLKLLRQCACIVGNSSAGIKEASFLGTPAVNIGSRQGGRMHGENVVNATEDASAIKNAIARQLEHGRYPQSQAYYKPDCAKHIAEALATATPNVQKRFRDA